MKKHLPILLAVIGGFAGGQLSRFTGPLTAHAQNQPTTIQSFDEVVSNSIKTNQIQTQAIVLTDEGGQGRAVLRVQSFPVRNGWEGRIVLQDTSGTVLWSAGGPPFRRPDSR